MITGLFFLNNGVLSHSKTFKAFLSLKYNLNSLLSLSWLFNKIFEGFFLLKRFAVIFLLMFWRFFVNFLTYVSCKILLLFCCLTLKPVLTTSRDDQSGFLHLVFFTFLFFFFLFSFCLFLTFLFLFLLIFFLFLCFSRLFLFSLFSFFGKRSQRLFDNISFGNNCKHEH